MDEGQERGEIATREAGRPVSVTTQDTYQPATLTDLGISRQERGEIATARDGATIRDLVLSPDKVPPATLTDLGISRQRLHEARRLEPLSDADKP